VRALAFFLTTGFFADFTPHFAMANQAKHASGDGVAAEQVANSTQGDSLWPRVTALHPSRTYCRSMSITIAGLFLRKNT
jgi:hypothetical protein